jgi:SPP1 family predicted phage head-tail adaptor
MPVGAGALDTRITLQSVVDVADGQGGVTRTWTQAASVWAAEKFTSGGESSEAGGTPNRRQYEYTIRRRSVSSAMRVLRGSRVMGIVGINDSREHPDVVVLTCEEVTA